MTRLASSLHGRIGTTASLLLILLAGCSTPEGLPDEVTFNRHIRPILADNCYQCHGPDENTREGDLRLDLAEDATRKRDGYVVVAPGKPHKSELIRRVKLDPADEDYMPHEEANKALSAHQIALLERWIDQGAEWEDHWAFISPEMPRKPWSLRGSPPSAFIDYLLEEEIDQQGLTTAGAATDEQLIRRLSYILTGLPPTPDEVSHFLADESEGRYEALVDHYLDSPHFGERWARHWMDVIRYSDSMGHEDDGFIGGAWRYRDYLIRAYNEDLPYDQFVVEHLAGDLLASPRYHPSEAYNESVIGTAYLTLGEAKSFPVSLKQEETERINTMIDVTATAFQALSVACARCHDHKFDPIPTKDYYAMYGMIESTRITPWPAEMTPEREARLADAREVKGQIRERIAPSVTSSSTSPHNSVQLANTEPALVVDSSVMVIGDFRDGNWQGWAADGWAFADAPLQEDVAFDPARNQFEWISEGRASSRHIAPGLPGALRSPTFVIEHDSLLFRIRGSNGTARVIIDHYQPINATLYGDLHFFVEDADWVDRAIAISTWKGERAYLEFIPGHYNMQQHTLQADDYIEVSHALAFNGDRPVEPPGAAGAELPASDAQLDDLLQEYASLASSLHDSTYFIGLIEGDALHSPVYLRGDFKQKSEEMVPHGFLHAIDAGPDEFPQDGTSRLAWAQAVVDPANPLTARIMVNRLWHHVYGRGLVETVDNFGAQGKPPTHPALLDYLALQFMEEGWSLKSILKHMVMTEAFQRSTLPSEANEGRDAENLFLSHYSLRRLEAEAIRDGVLAVSSRLDRTMFGEAVPVDYTPFKSSFKTNYGPKESGPLDGEGRRSIYQTIRRNYLNPLMLTFDMPVPYATVGRRIVSYTPAQSLSLLNHPFFHEQAEVWAQEIVKEDADFATRIEAIYIQAFSRKPTEAEVQTALDFLVSQAETYDSSLDEMEDDSRLWADYCHSIFNLKEFIHLL